MAPSGPTGAASRRCAQRPRHAQPPTNRRTRSHRPRAGSDGCSSDGRRGRPYGGNRRLTPTDAITAPASSTPRAPVGRFRGLPVVRSATAARAALALPGLAVFFYQDAPAFEEVDAPAARGAFASASHNPSSSRGSEAIRSTARKPAPRRLGADSDNAAFERPRQSRPNPGDTASLGRIGSDRCHGLDCCSGRKPAASQLAPVRRSLRETKRQSPMTASADDA